ncbi:hypothetical protein VP01_1716g1 [Puccinia sorghi]|uniref:Uncharacterized protein n=1 Tax=Puccinia sorghi TaxID=27349 RepID=A0A0L6VHC1_9BASI|nr:hypothetical protein VP01_1716g1 [Puccinia sorghi]
MMMNSWIHSILSPKPKANCHLLLSNKTLLASTSFFCIMVHLLCNVSRENCKTAIQMIMNILQVATKHPNTPQVLRMIPRDPQTLIKRAQLDITLTKKMCCQFCFCLCGFEPSDLWLCTYKHFNNLDPCGKEIFVSANVVATPPCVFLSQSMLTWNTWLLSNAETKEEMEEWIQVNQDRKDQGYPSDIQHGQNFVNTDWKTETDMLKILSLFVGGLILMEKRSEERALLPDPQIFHHLLSPLVDKIIIIDALITIPTYQFPNSQCVHSKFLAVYGDILETKKQDKRKKKKSRQLAIHWTPIQQKLKEKCSIGLKESYKGIFASNGALDPSHHRNQITNAELPQNQHPALIRNLEYQFNQQWRLPPRKRFGYPTQTAMRTYYWIQAREEVSLWATIWINSAAWGSPFTSQYWHGKAWEIEFIPMACSLCIHHTYLDFA